MASYWDAVLESVRAKLVADAFFATTGIYKDLGVWETGLDLFEDRITAALVTNGVALGIFLLNADVNNPNVPGPFVDIDVIVRTFYNQFHVQLSARVSRQEVIEKQMALLHHFTPTNLEAVLAEQPGTLAAGIEEDGVLISDLKLVTAGGIDYP